MRQAYRYSVNPDAVGVRIECLLAIYQGSIRLVCASYYCTPLTSISMNMSLSEFIRVADPCLDPQIVFVFEGMTCSILLRVQPDV